MSRSVTVFLALLVGASFLFADENKDRAVKLYDRFMAPCCYTGLLTDHQSRAADDMKEEILRFVIDGKSDQEIFDFYVAQHGERILSQPPGEGFNRLMVIAPVLLVVIGFFFITGVIRRQRQTARKSAGGDVPAGLDPDMDDEIEREIREGF